MLWWLYKLFALLAVSSVDSVYSVDSASRLTTNIQVVGISANSKLCMDLDSFKLYPSSSTSCTVPSNPQSFPLSSLHVSSTQFLLVISSHFVPRSLFLAELPLRDLHVCFQIFATSSSQFRLCFLQIYLSSFQMSTHFLFRSVPDPPPCSSQYSCKVLSIVAQLFIPDLDHFHSFQV